MNRIDIIRTSASRPDLLERTTKSLIKHIKYSGELRFIIHEDIINKELSNKCLKYATRGCYRVIGKHEPPIGQGNSLDWLLKQTKTEFVLNWEDDFELVRELDLNKVIDLMNNGCNINQICFNKRTTMIEKPDFVKKQVWIENDILTTNPHWALIPALWRMSYIMPKWFPFKQGHHWDFNNSLKGQENNRSANWVIENTGTYYMGGFGEPAYVKHLGCGRSLREMEQQIKWEQGNE